MPWLTSPEWEKLSRRPDLDLRATGRAWFVTVALHEALRH